MIFTLNNRDNASFMVMKNILELDDKEMNQVFTQEFEICKKRLSMKGINYGSLKRALIPNKDSDKMELCIVLNSEGLGDRYGKEVFKYLTPLLNAESTYSILIGDYIDILHDVKNSQEILEQIISDKINIVREYNWVNSNQFYLMYFNSLSRLQFSQIVEGLKDYDWFIGYIDVSERSYFKTYLDMILVPKIIKNKKTIIMPHPEDCRDEENQNPIGYCFEKHGYQVKSINELSYNGFLSYKIESLIPDSRDVYFSINAISEAPSSLSDLTLIVDDNKWTKYLTVKDKSKKGGIVETIGYSINDKERFIKEIKERIDKSYIYCLDRNEYGMKFDVCIDHPTQHGHIRKTLVALQYYSDSKTVKVITVT